MKNLLLIIVIIFCSNAYCQQYEGQKFCVGDEDGDYFPLNISKKKIIWYSTYYYETQKDTLINSKLYIQFEQKWKNGTIDYLYLREDQKIILQYEDCCSEETIRYNPKSKIGESWLNADKSEQYVITSFTGTLKTPYCNYKDLMIINANVKGVVFEFYYLKNHGYIGAKKDNKLISYVTPEW